MKIKDSEPLLQAQRHAQALLLAHKPTKREPKWMTELRVIVLDPAPVAVVDARYPPRDGAKP